MTVYCINIEEFSGMENIAHDIEIFSRLETAKKNFAKLVMECKARFGGKGWMEHDDLGIYETWPKDEWNKTRYGIYLTEHEVV